MVDSGKKARRVWSHLKSAPSIEHRRAACHQPRKRPVADARTVAQRALPGCRGPSAKLLTRRATLPIRPPL